VFNFILGFITLYSLLWLLILRGFEQDKFIFIETSRNPELMRLLLRFTEMVSWLGFLLGAISILYLGFVK
jgi:hypothetical protein